MRADPDSRRPEPDVSFAMLVVGALTVLGSMGTAAIPFTLDAAIHKSSALLYFFGTVVLLGAISAQEWTLRLPRVDAAGGKVYSE